MAKPLFEYLISIGDSAFPMNSGVNGEPSENKSDPLKDQLSIDNLIIQDTYAHNHLDGIPSIDPWTSHAELAQELCERSNNIDS